MVRRPPWLQGLRAATGSASIYGMHGAKLVQLILVAVLVASSAFMWNVPVQALSATSAVSVSGIAPGGAHGPVADVLGGAAGCATMACSAIPVSGPGISFTDASLPVYRLDYKPPTGGRLLIGPDPYPPKDLQSL